MRPSEGVAPASTDHRQSWPVAQPVTRAERACDVAHIAVISCAGGVGHAATGTRRLSEDVTDGDDRDEAAGFIVYIARRLQLSRECGVCVWGRPPLRDLKLLPRSLPLSTAIQRRKKGRGHTHNQPRRSLARWKMPDSQTLTPCPRVTWSLRTSSYAFYA